MKLSGKIESRIYGGISKMANTVLYSLLSKVSSKSQLLPSSYNFYALSDLFSDFVAVICAAFGDDVSSLVLS